MSNERELVKPKLKVAIYVRVSTQDQNLDNQINSLKEYCLNNEYEIFNIYNEKVSGFDDNRPELNKLMIDLRAKKFNAVVIWKLDRLGRSIQHLIQLVKEMENKKINLIVTTQNIDTTTATGKLVFHMFGAFAEFERDLISERTKLGLVRARKDGKQLGRPRKNPIIYTHFCMVSGCREKIEQTRHLCDKHKNLEKMLVRSG